MKKQKKRPYPETGLIIDWDRKTVDIRQSDIQSFLDCRRRFKFERLQHLQPDYGTGVRPWSKSRDTGTAFHEAMGAYYLDKSPAAAVRKWVRKEFGDTPPEADIELVEIMVKGHIDDLAEDGADVGEDTIAVEQKVYAAYDVGEWTVYVHCTCDRLIETDAGLKIIDDWKSNTKLDSTLDYIQQLGRYAVVVRDGLDWRADRVRSTQVKRVKRTGDGPFYARPWLPLNEDAYIDHETNLRDQLADMMRVILGNGPYYEHVTTECSWKCFVQDICKAMQQGDDPGMMVDLHYRKKEPRD